MECGNIPQKGGRSKNPIYILFINVTAHRSKRSFQVEDFTFVAGHLLV
jgi:hypothetical protein